MGWLCMKDVLGALLTVGGVVSGAQPLWVGLILQVRHGGTSTGICNTPTVWLGFSGWFLQRAIGDKTITYLTFISDELLWGISMSLMCAKKIFYGNSY